MRQNPGAITGLRAVLKVGGSLGRDDDFPELCRALSDLSEKHRLLVVPGGGRGADCVRDYDRRLGLSDEAAHWMAILAMDQYGLLLEDLIKSGKAVCSLSGAARVLDSGGLPVLLPYTLLKKEDPLPHSWQVTSDSIAAWIARKTGARDLLLLKHVDGLFAKSPGSKQGKGVLVSEVSPDDLGRFSEVDPFLAGLMKEKGLGLWLLNGTRPERLAELFETGSTLGTRLLPSGL